MSEKVSNTRERKDVFLPADVKKLVDDEITWAQMADVTKEQAYAIAELGYNLFQQGKLSEARKIFEGLVSINPRDSYFHLMLGCIWGRLKNWENALESLNSSINCGSKDPQIHLNRAEVYVELGRFKDALNDLNQVIAWEGLGESPTQSKARLMAQTIAQAIDSVLKKG